MKALELRKRADKSGPQPADGQPWPFARMELVSEDLPEKWKFSEGFVNQAVVDGWVVFSGKEFTYEVVPDPLGSYKNMATQVMTLPGDHLVLTLWKGEQELTVTYKILDGPVPMGFRAPDDSDDGFRNDPAYHLELEETA